MAEGSHPEELLGARSFWLEWGNERVGSFKEISGLFVETEVRQVQQSAKGGQEVLIKSVGADREKTGPITVKYAALRNDPVLKWRQEVGEGGGATSV